MKEANQTFGSGGQIFDLHHDLLVKLRNLYPNEEIVFYDDKGAFKLVDDLADGYVILYLKADGITDNLNMSHPTCSFHHQVDGYTLKSEFSPRKNNSWLYKIDRSYLNGILGLADKDNI